MTETLEATYRIVTPMFLGGADQTPTDGVRAPSFKGALRFWWRAIHWARFRIAASCDEQALRSLHDEEARLFGLAASRDQVSGQGVFLLRVTRQPKLATESSWPQNNSGSGYLGYGLMGTNETPHRQGIREGGDFTVQLRFKPRTKPADVESIQDAMQALSLFGGLGSRARRGFGSLTLASLNDQDMMLNAAGFEQAACDRLASVRRIEEFPPYTAFSHQAGFSILATGQDARQVHKQAGLLYKNHRGQASTLRGADKIPFGLPLQGIDQDSRRASPLLFHVHALRDGQFVASVLYVPSVFHYDPRYCPTDLRHFNRDVARFVATEACA